MKNLKGSLFVVGWAVGILGFYLHNDTLFYMGFVIMGAAILILSRETTEQQLARLPPGKLSEINQKYFLKYFQPLAGSLFLIMGLVNLVKSLI